MDESKLRKMTLFKGWRVESKLVHMYVAEQTAKWYIYLIPILFKDHLQSAIQPGVIYNV